MKIGWRGYNSSSLLKKYTIFRTTPLLSWRIKTFSGVSSVSVCFVELPSTALNTNEVIFYWLMSLQRRCDL